MNEKGIEGGNVPGHEEKRERRNALINEERRERKEMQVY